MKLDEQRALLATGDGVVARLPGIVLVAVPETTVSRTLPRPSVPKLAYCAANAASSAS